MAMNFFKSLIKSFSTAATSKLILRGASAKEMDVITRRAIKEGCSIGPYDFECVYSFQSKGCYICEVDGQVISHIITTTYPNHHSYAGGLIVAEEYRNRGFGKKTIFAAFDILSKDSILLGFDAVPELRPLYESLGFETVWNTYTALLSLDKIVKNIYDTDLPLGIAAKPVCSKNLENFLTYDSCVFGTQRERFLEKWISVPGSFGLVAIDEKNNDVVGYAILRQVIRNSGSEIGMAVAPLFADNVSIAKLLLKTAAQECISNKAVPKTKLQLSHPVGDICGAHASQLMKDLEAELSLDAYRMYFNGDIPSGRQLEKIYGIASNTFD